MTMANIKIVPGQRHGQLLVICRVPNNKFGQSRWLCACDCGREKEIVGFSLTQGVSKSCGCLRGKSLARYRESYPHAKLLPPGVAAVNRLFRSYQDSAAQDDREFCLERATFDRLIAADCHYCGAPPSRTQHPGTSRNARNVGGSRMVNGIDRIDNTVGYREDNCVACCRTCNLAKRDLSYAEFVAWLLRAADHLRRGNGQQAIAVQ